MSDNREVIIVDESQTCFSSGALPHYDLKREAQTQLQAHTQQVGADCPNCRAPERNDAIRMLDDNR